MLANRFADFFLEKTSTIRRDLQNYNRLPSVDQTPYPAETCFAELFAVAHEEVKALASKSISKSCSLVPLPSHIINGCFNWHTSSYYNQYCKFVACNWHYA